MIKSKKQMYLVIGAFALVMLLGGVTYAFFNYTRTGTANTIRTGRISFNTSQSNTLNLTNVFPMSSTQAENANLDAVSVRIWGDTIYSGGEEYEISIVDVNNTIGSGASAKTIPINYIASYTATPVQSGDPNVIGTNSDSYFTARGQSSPVYQLSATGEATNGEQVLIGYIPSGATGIDGTLTIKAYLDSSKIAISDTYNDGNTPTDNMGTPASFGEGKTVLTTTEWNALQNTQTPLSFKIKAISQEGTWVEEPLPDYPIPSCPGCVFVRPEDNHDNYATWNTVSETPTTISNYSNDYHDVILEDNAFLGIILNGDKAERVFACSIYNDNPFCVEGALDNSKYNSNVNVLQHPSLWNGSSDYDMGNGGYVALYDNGGVEIDLPNSAGIVIVSNDGSFGIYTN